MAVAIPHRIHHQRTADRRLLPETQKIQKLGRQAAARAGAHTTHNHTEQQQISTDIKSQPTDPLPALFRPLNQSSETLATSESVSPLTNDNSSGLRAEKSNSTCAEDISSRKFQLQKKERKKLKLNES